MAKYDRDHAYTKEIVKRYDEVISLKVNKSNLFDVEKKIYERFARRDEVTEKFDDHGEQLRMVIADFKKLDGALNYLRRELSKSINEAVERSTKRLENRLIKKPLRHTWQSYSPRRDST